MEDGCGVVVVRIGSSVGGEVENVMGIVVLEEGDEIFVGWVVIVVNVGDVAGVHVGDAGVGLNLEGVHCCVMIVWLVLSLLFGFSRHHVKMLLQNMPAIVHVLFGVGNNVKFADVCKKRNNVVARLFCLTLYTTE